MALVGLTGGQKAGQLVAAKQRLIQMRDARHAGVLGVAQDGGSQLDGPAQPFQFADSNEGMLVGRGVALVVEVVEQGRGGVELDERGTLLGVAGADESQPIGFRLAAGHHAGLHGQRVLAQVLAQGPFGQQLPGLVTAVAFVLVAQIGAGGHVSLSLSLDVVYVSSAFSG
jgi:hypothetical protein